MIEGKYAFGAFKFWLFNQDYLTWADMKIKKEQQYWILISAQSSNTHTHTLSSTEDDNQLSRLCKNIRLNARLKCQSHLFLHSLKIYVNVFLGPLNGTIKKKS